MTQPEPTADFVRRKHVLCEKPIALNAVGVAPLIETRDRTGLVVEEAFMVRDHPQWMHVRGLLDAGCIDALYRSGESGQWETVGG